MIVGFLLGSAALTALFAAIFFLKFWHRTRDGLFLAFAFFFVVEAAGRVIVLPMDKPNEGSPWFYLVRLLASLLILASILRKNYGQAR